MEAPTNGVPDDADVNAELPWTPFERNCIALVEGAPKTRSRNCFRSAVAHLNKAYRLVGTDAEMAVFRTITAEEQAASGLMYVVRESGYPSAIKLKPRDHVHKSAITPLLIAMGNFFEQTIGKIGVETSLMLQQHEGERRLLLGLSGLVPDQVAQPIPPLNLNISSTVRGLVFVHELEKYSEQQGGKDVLEHLRKLANTRNKLLYASHEGIPAVKGLSADFVLHRKKRIFAMLCGYLMIYPYGEKQPFVQLSIDTLLSVLQTAAKQTQAPIGSSPPPTT